MNAYASLLSESYLNSEDLVMKKKHPGYSFIAALALMVSCVSLNCFAKDAGMNSSSQKHSSMASFNLPESGLSKDHVLREYGMPLSKTAGIGAPPISRWHYATYTVYFEFNYVIHTVFNPS